MQLEAGASRRRRDLIEQRRDLVGVRYEAIENSQVSLEPSRLAPRTIEGTGLDVGLHLVVHGLEGGDVRIEGRDLLRLVAEHVHEIPANRAQ